MMPCMCWECMSGGECDASKEPEPESSLPPATSLEYWKDLATEQIEANKALSSLVKTLTERVYKQGQLIASYAEKGTWVPHDSKRSS